MPPHHISLESAIALTGLSRRTWWRHIAEGQVNRVADDARGRAMLAWADVLPRLSAPLDAPEQALVLLADAGDASAQNDLGQIFFAQAQFKAAGYWWQQAAKKGHADAMQWLGHCYLTGQGVMPDEYLALMWIARAAAHGHVIAQAQMRGLWPKRKSAAMADLKNV